LVASYGFKLAKSGSVLGEILTVVAVIVGGIITVIICFKERHPNPYKASGSQEVNGSGNE